MLDATIRVRTVAWSATTAVLAVLCTLLVTQAWSVDAAPGDNDSTFVPTAGCRLADTRPGADNIGPRSTPIGPGGIFEVTVHGTNGQCTGPLAIPTDAVAVALNVTSVNPTANSNIRLYPANLTTVPLLSNLNVTPGGPATPNKVDVKLSPDGKIRVFNQAGSVDVILDVVGYYTNSTLQDLQTRLLAAESAIATAETTIAALETSVASNRSRSSSNASGISTNASGIAALDEAQPFAVTASLNGTITVSADEVVESVTVQAPVDGQVTVNSTTYTFETTEGGGVSCSITTGSTVDGAFLQQWESGGQDDGEAGQLAGTRTFDITAGDTVTYNLVCGELGNVLNANESVNDPVLTAIFTPAR